jgi:assimilatory nitrate reductase catalytic subunit
VDDGDAVLVESRRAAIEFRVHVSGDIRVDTLFAPFHWGGKRAANALTIGALDPTSRMPEFKVCAVKARAAGPGRPQRPAPGSSRGGHVTGAPLEQDKR